MIRLSKKGSSLNWASSPSINVKDRRPMTAKEFNAACATLGIGDHVTAARLFGLSWRTCQRYHYDELSVPGPLARLLRLAIKHKLSQKDLAVL